MLLGIFDNGVNRIFRFVDIAHAVYVIIICGVLVGFIFIGPLMLSSARLP